MNYYLYLDTSGSHSFTMIMNDEEVLVSRTNSETMNHAAFINVHIKEMLDELSISMKELKAVFVLNGPGSYTGLRISLSVAKGICYACDLPLYLLNRLDLMQVSSKSSQACCSIIKARENEFFLALYSSQGKLLEPYQILSKDEVENKADETHSKLLIDASLEVEFPQAIVVTIKKDGIFACCSKKMNALEEADLFTSEPFYLKNVHVNKINKL